MYTALLQGMKRDSPINPINPNNLINPLKL
jgi:hypothetical protein